MNSNEHGRGKIWIDIYFLNHSIKHIFLGSFPRLTGSAPHWQCGGQGFESPMLHQKIRMHMHSDFFLIYSFYFWGLFLYILPIMRSAAIVNNTTRQGKSIHNVRRAPLCITDSSPKTKYITNSKIITAATAMQRTKILAVLFFIKSPSFQINKCYHSALPLCSFL